MKLLTFTIPCYNSQDYMRHCIESILPGGEDVEILIVDDGSKDDTAAIADEYAEKYPTIVKAIHQENGGHGEAVNAGIRNATGLYFKVVDSDDWVDWNAYQAILAKLREIAGEVWHLICFWQIMYMRRKGQNTSGSCVRPVFRKIRSLPGVMCGIFIKDITY